MKKGKRRKNRSRDPQKGAKPPSLVGTSGPFFSEKLRASFRGGVMVILCAELLWGGWMVTQQLMQTAPPSLQINPKLMNVHDGLRHRVVSLQQRLVSTVLADQTPVAWLDLGSLYLASGRYPQAELCLRVAKRMDPDSSNIAYALGASLDLLGRSSEAIEQYRLASRSSIGRRKDACFYLIGKNYLRQEDPENAIKAFREVDTFLPASYELVKALIRTGEIDLAASEMRILDQNRPHAMETHMLKSWIADAQGEPTVAAEQRALADRAARGLAYAPLQEVSMDFRKRFP